MNEWVFRLIVVAVAGCIIVALARKRYVFEIRVSDGVPVVRRGQVTRAFLDVLAEACRADGVTRGWVAGVPRGGRMTLKFSHHFAPGTQQRVRNQWHATG